MIPHAIAKAIAARAASDRPTPDRLQDGDRLRRADQAGQGLDARRAARRRRDQRRAREARLGACALRGAGRGAGGLAGSRRARRRAAQGLGAACGQARADAFCAIRSTGRQPRPSRQPSPRSRPSSWRRRPSSPRASPRRRCWRSWCRCCPRLIGGSADLTGSNGTRTKHHTPVTAGQLRRQLHPLRRARARHGRGHERTGAARRHRPLRGDLPGLHRLLPAVDPAVGADGQRVIYVMTHDSIGLGEDGPTHQPVEQLASLRAMPNLNVFRPADAIEVAECWELALLGVGHAVDPGADPAGIAGAAHEPARREPVRQGCLRAGRGGRRQARRHASSRPAPRSSLAIEAREQLGKGWRSRRSGVDAVLGAVRRPAGQLPQSGAGLGAAHRRRGRHRHGLGALARRQRYVHRHERASALRRRRPSCSSISASRPPTSRRQHGSW